MVKLEKTIKYGIYLAMLLPLVFTSRTMFPWHFGKTVLFQMLVEILLVLALVYFSLNKDPAQKQVLSGASRKIVRLNLLDWLVLAFVLLQLISSVFGVNFVSSFWGNQQRVQGVFTWLHFTAFYFLLRQFFTTKKDWQNLGIFVLAVSFISCFIAWVGPYFSIFDNIITKGGRISGMIGNPIFFAGYLIIPVFLGFSWFFILDKNSKWRWLSLLTGIFGLITFLFAQTRGAFIGLIAGILAIFAIYLFFGQTKKTKQAVAVAGLLFIILLSGLYVFNQKSDYLNNNFSLASNLLNIKLSATTADTRLMAWQIAFKGWQDKPVFGWGPENFQDIFNKHYNPEFLKYSFAETVWDKPHSYPLEVLSAMGISGFICYLAIVLALLIYLVNIIKKQDNKNRRLAFMILAGAVVAYVIQNSFAFETSNSLLIWMMLIASIAFYYSYFQKENEELKKYDNKFLYKVIGWAAILIIIVTPYFLYKNWTFYQASVCMGDTRDAEEIESLYLWQKNAPKVLAAEVPFFWEQAIFLTKDLSTFDGKQILDKKTLETAAYQLADIFEENIQKYPTSFVMRFWAGQLYSFMGEYINSEYFGRSEQLLKEALDINRQNQNAALVLAKTYLLQDKVEEGIKILKEINQNSIGYEETHWFLGLALVQDGQKDRGMEELEKGIDFGSGIDNNILYLIDLYAETKQYEKIISLYEKLIIRNPKNPQYYASIAVAYAEIGDEENVMININKAVELQPVLAEEAKKFLEQYNIDIEKYK
ncbi:O-antigen ligase family protein [Patescibacteria group bacterium]|nr:hypothetical protein [Candidatus Falkowbacteria bacterium]MBU3906057.1 O-antigen ligase family protein [Patescibacteria group bacterium]MBU4015086.1 O-antigen ligase family protein [Patescibacteria group bacterium]MBU4026202.1 O-antigen ligase family protein [Patescibacteria group bacterium]MBU4073706.1 O-antigen ligase family protein [Patescibacteria group bacterium]